MSRYLTLSKPKVVAAGKARPAGTWEPIDETHRRGDAQQARFFSSDQYVERPGGKHGAPAQSPPHNRAPAAEPYSQAPVPLIHQALFPEVKPPPPPPAFITDQKVDPDISKHFRASASAQMLDSLIFNIREETKTKKSKRADAEVGPAVPSSKTPKASAVGLTSPAHAAKSNKHLAASLSSPLAQTMPTGSPDLQPVSVSVEELAHTFSRSVEETRLLKNSLHDMAKTADLIMGLTRSTRPEVWAQNSNAIRRELDRMTSINMPTSSNVERLQSTVQVAAANALVAAQPHLPFVDPSQPAPDSFDGIPFVGYGEITSKPTGYDRLKSSVVGSPQSFDARSPPSANSQLVPHLSASAPRPIATTGGSFAKETSTITPRSGRNTSSATSSSPAFGMNKSGSVGLLSPGGGGNVTSPPPASASMSTRTPASPAVGPGASRLHSAADDDEPTAGNFTSTAGLPGTMSPTKDLSRPVTTKDPMSPSATPSGETPAAPLVSPSRVNTAGAGRLDVIEESVDDGIVVHNRTNTVTSPGPISRSGPSATPAGTSYNDRQSMDGQPLLPQAREPDSVMSEAAIAAANKLNAQPYPAFFNRPDVLHKIPLHPQYHFVVPSARQPVAVLKAELGPRYATPVSQVAPLLYHVDRSDAFRLPPTFTESQLALKLGDNKTMVEAAKLFKRMMGKRQTLLIPGSSSWPLVFTLTLFVPSPQFMIVQPHYGDFELEVELFDDEPILCTVNSLMFDCEDSEAMNMGMPGQTMRDLVVDRRLPLEVSAFSGELFPDFYPLAEFAPLVIETSLAQPAASKPYDRPTAKKMNAGSDKLGMMAGIDPMSAELSSTKHSLAAKEQAAAANNKSTAIVPVAGNALHGKRAAPLGSSAQSDTLLIQPPKLDSFAEQVASTSNQNPLPNLMSTFGVQGGGDTQAAQGGADDGSGARRPGVDPGMAIAGDTIAALTSILKDKVNSTENVAMSSMFAMLQQQQQQMFQMQKDQMQFFMKQTTEASQPAKVTGAAMFGGPMGATMGMGSPTHGAMMSSPYSPHHASMQQLPSTSPYAASAPAGMNFGQSNRYDAPSLDPAPMASTAALDRYYDTNDKTDAMLLRPTVQLTGNKVKLSTTAGSTMVGTSMANMEAAVQHTSSAQTIQLDPRAPDMHDTSVYSTGGIGTGNVAKMASATVNNREPIMHTQKAGLNTLPLQAPNFSSPAFSTGMINQTSTMMKDPDASTFMLGSPTNSKTQMVPDLSPEASVPDEIRKELFTRVLNNRFRQVEQMLAGGVPVNVRDERGNTPLHVACQTNNKKMAKLCLRWGAELNSQNAQGQTALHYCFAYHYDELGAYLIEKGASDSITNYFGWTCYDGLRPDDAQEALFLLRQHLGPQASMDIISGGTMQPPPAQGE